MTKLLSRNLNIFIIFLLAGISLAATVIFHQRDQIVAYGDAESHLNIAKRVIDSLTPGLAQLGGIWLPLPHLMLSPLTFFEPLYRTGLAGSIVSGIFFVLSGFTIFKLIILLTENKMAAYLATLLYALNANVLYLQSTAMTEVPLLAFFIFSIYFFVSYLKRNDVLSLVFAAFFGLCATLSRYDGWFLVMVEGVVLVVHGLINRYSFRKIEGLAVLFSTMAFVGILAWLLWDFLILGDPLYFTNSPFSAKSQQQDWLARGELPAYKNITSALTYYGYTSYLNIGKYLSLFAAFSVLPLLFFKAVKERFYLLLLLISPFIFNVLTLYMGQSVIFVPQLTPDNFEWNLFNVRYGVMMIPAAVIFSALFAAQLTGYMYKFQYFAFMPLAIILLLQSFSFAVGSEKTITLEDAVYGLSSSKKTDAQDWLRQNYDGGLVLLDDYARSVSIIKSGLPIEQIIYIGNKPYWEESLAEPEKHARWIVMQQNDIVWTNLYQNQTQLDRVFKYFERTYTSPNIVIFKRIDQSRPTANRSTVEAKN